MLIKKFFSKIFVFAVALILQVLIIAAVLYFFELYFAVFQIISTVIGLLVFLNIVNKKENPEFKLPWMVVLFVLPLFGMVVYFMFANSKMSPAQYKYIIAISCRCKHYIEIPKAENERLMDVLGDRRGIENYLRNNSLSRGHLHNRVEFFGSGEKFYADLLCELEKAEKFIFMEYFIIDHGKMWESIREILVRKARSGVEVRVMYDDIGTLGMLKSNFYKKLRKEGINCCKFNPFRPVMSGIHNNRDHRKITVIDGKTAYTGGANIGDEYINEKSPHGYWKDTAIKIRGSAVANFTLMFLQLFDATEKRLSDYDKYFNVDCGRYDDEGYVHPFGDGPKPFYKELVGESVIIDMLNGAKEYIYISTPYLIPDYNLITALRCAAFRGVDVRIITPHIPDKKIILNMSRSNYKYLLQAGVRIFEYTPGFIHSKAVVADGEYAFVGTINLDFRSLVHHYECGAILCKTPCISDIKKDFDGTIEVSDEITLKNFKMSFTVSLINAVLNLFSPMF